MLYILIIREEANNEMAQAYLYYEEIQEGLGERFLTEVSNRYNDISRNPRHYGFIDDNKIFRDVKVKHFPYQIIYEIIENAVIVYSVFNSYQNPATRT